jgi:hypothetical protein
MEDQQEDGEIEVGKKYLHCKDQAVGIKAAGCYEQCEFCKNNWQTLFPKYELLPNGDIKL